MKINFSPEEIKKQFRASMNEIATPDAFYELKADGQLQRYHIKGDKAGTKNGAYVLHIDDGYPAGFIQNWKGEKINWKFNVDNSSLTQEERNYFNSPEYQKELAEKQRQRDEKHKQLQAKASEQASKDFYSYIDSSEIQHPYLEKKNVKVYGARFFNQEKKIVVPLFNIEGKIQSLQFIDKDGNKKFYPHASTSGAFFSMGLQTSQESDPILVCEGFATGSKIHQLTGLPTVCAMSCDNVINVTKAFKSSSKYKDRQIIIMTDNDIKTEKGYKAKNGVAFNPGINAGKKAVEAGNAIGYIAPTFNYETPEGSDWDDYALTHGDRETAEIMKSEIQKLIENTRNTVITTEQAQNTDSGQPDKTRQDKTNGQDNISAPFKKYSSFTPIDCEEYTPPEWIIEGYMTENTLNMMFGAPKSGKSYVALDMAFTVSTAKIETWHGQKVKHGSVIYFAGEGTDGIKKRLKVWRDKYGINSKDMKIEVIDEAFKVDGVDAEHSLDATIWNIKQISEKPALIIFDTLNRYMAGDENSTKDSTSVTDAFTRIQKETGAATLVLHHTGHAEKGRARGSSVFGGNFDCMMKIEGSEGRITLKHEYSKDEAKQKPIVFNLEEREIPEWIREDGKPVTACTIELNDSATTLTATQLARPVKIPQSEITAKDTYAEAAEKYGEIITDETRQDGQDKTFIAVCLEKWREVFYENSSADKKGTKQKQFDRARQLLRENKKLLFIRRINDRDYYCLNTDNNLLGTILKEKIETRIAKNPEQTDNIF